MLRQLVPQFRELLENPDQPVLYRLFPPAYSETAHAEQQDEYRRLMQEDLVERHREELDLVAATADADHLSEEQLQAWTRALNSVRLVLGTSSTSRRVTRNDSRAAPRSRSTGGSRYLQGEAIEALAGRTLRGCGQTGGHGPRRRPRFLRANHRSVLVTRKRNGDPQLSPVNHGVDEQGRVCISSREPAYKVRNLRRDARATLLGLNDGFYGEWVQVDGTAELLSLPGRHGAARRALPADPGRASRLG